ncbi:MAG: flagellar hook-basal body complex protein FliE, partial [Rhodoferax sp.]
MPTAVRPTLAPRFPTSQVTGAAEGGGFSGVLKNALTEVSASQNDASRL